MSKPITTLRGAVLTLLTWALGFIAVIAWTAAEVPV